MFSSPRVLFICVHNGGRSQMCEAFLKHYADDRFDAQSAGLDPGELNPLAVEAMAEIGIDISQNQTKSVFHVWESGEVFQLHHRRMRQGSSREMSNLPGTHKTFTLAVSRPVKSHRHVRAEVAEGTRNSRRDRIQDSSLVGVSSGRTIGLRYVGYHCPGRRDSPGAGADVAAVAVW